MALSISFGCISVDTEIATAAEISEGLNSKKSTPAFNSNQHFIKLVNPQEQHSTNTKTVRDKPLMMLNISSDDFEKKVVERFLSSLILLR